MELPLDRVLSQVITDEKCHDDIQCLLNPTSVHFGVLTDVRGLFRHGILGHALLCPFLNQYCIWIRMQLVQGSAIFLSLVY